MTSRLTPYLSFKDTAREAMEFYRSVFGGRLAVNTFGEFGDQDGPGADLVFHSLLETPSGFTLMANDAAPGSDSTPSADVSISLSGEAAADGAELRGYWEKLAAGGAITVPLEKQVWGDDFGLCADRFGVTWMVNISGIAEA